jgi:hypothetical protein
MHRSNASAVRRFFTILLVGLVLAGCSIKLAPDYDSATFEEVLRVGKLVDRFYGDLLETPADSRPYAKYADRYVGIETELRSLYVRNNARALNQESTEISEIILTLWIKYKTNHASKNAYKDGVAKLDRARFTRLFISAADAETAKKLGTQDKNPEAESQ